MILTDEKIAVTYAMMVQANMTRGDEYGVPVNLQELWRGLRWKKHAELTDEDYDTLEAYFLLKQEQAK